MQYSVKSKNVIDYDVEAVIIYKFNSNLNSIRVYLA